MDVAASGRRGGVRGVEEVVVAARVWWWWERCRRSGAESVWKGSRCSCPLRRERDGVTNEDWRLETEDALEEEVGGGEGDERDKRRC